MAAEFVIWENLHRTLRSEEVQQLPHMELTELTKSVGLVKGILVALEGENTESRDVIHRKLGNLVALLHQSEDLLNEILSAHRKRLASEHSGDDDNLRRPLQKAIAASNKLKQEVSHFFSSLNPLVLAGKLKKITQSIEQLAKELKDKFPSIDLPDAQFDLSPNFRLVKNKVIGRDDDKEKLIGMLLQPKAQSHTNVSVIPMFGSPGVGKSALGWILYEDEKVKNHFDLRIWLQVSHISDERELIREIVDCCTNRKSNYGETSQPARRRRSRTLQKEVPFSDLLGCRSLATSVIPQNNENEMNVFERRLRKEIEGKLFLLILDDACIKDWSNIKDLLAGGAKGSQMLVITGSVEVAGLAKGETDKKYELKGLSLANCWSLFSELALQPQDLEDPDFTQIGKSICNSCERVPLTVRVAGSFLYGKSKEKWLSFENDLTFTKESGFSNLKCLEKQAMDHVLHHSYADLPARLKACFAYCSLFPEDFDFNKHDLISLWIAQGFVDPQHGQSLEEAGNKYFMELSRRCFFHDVSTDDSGNIVTCKMHPIIRNLSSLKAAGILNMHMADTVSTDVLDSTCRHVSVACDRDSSMKIPPSLLQAQSLRTLVSFKEPECKAKVDRFVCNALISSFKCLRVLDLQDLGMVELPDSIGKLIHLRYLDLSKNDRLLTLPRTVTKLYNLQTLKLNSCPNLRRLPGNFGELVNLQRFEVDECDSLTCMPLGLEKLTKLETLSRFIVGKESSLGPPVPGLEALRELNNLRGRLEIELIGDWMSNIHDLQAILLRKSHLTELNINWARPVSDVKNYLDLLEYLQPHPNLKILRIEGYKGEDFPSWARVDMLPDSLPNLVVVSIEGCDKCENLPPFGELPSLKRLTLRHMANVQYVESKGLSASSTEEATSYLESQESVASSSQNSTPASTLFFKSLEELTLHNFYKLEKWREDTMLASGVRYFPHLSKLSIWNCPKLTSMPLFPRWVDVDLRNVNQKLLEECAKKSSMGELPLSMKESSTKSLQIKRCPNLKNFKAVRKGLGGLPCLERLVIEKCKALISLTSDFRYLCSLKQLEISNCKELDLTNDGSDNMDDADTSSWISLRTSRNLAVGRIVETPWAYLRSLRDLTLKQIPKMKSLPEGLQHVQTLKFLWLSECNDLTVLPEWMGHLTALQHFRIESCPGLKRLPNSLKEVRSLIKVEITECPKLMERCREHKGEERHKIEHARILLLKSWRYGLMSEQGAIQNRPNSNVRTLDDVKYFIIPAIAAKALM